MGKDILDTALAALRRADNDPESMHDTVSLLSTRDMLVAVLRGVLNDSRRLAETAESSVRHANGFEKLVLATVGGFQLRLHVWRPSDPTEPRPLENAHNHRWCFVTAILLGSYRATTFVAVAGDDYTRYTYTPTGSRPDYELERAGACDLVVTSIAHHVNGSVYWLHPAMIHRVSPVHPHTLTASLVVVGPPVTTCTDVFVPRAQPVEAVGAVGAVGATRHVMLSPDDVVRSLVSLAGALDLAPTLR